MKVMVISSSAPSLLTFRKDMITALQRDGYEVLASAPEPAQEWAPRFKSFGVHYYSVPIERNGINPLKDIGTLIQLLKLIRSTKPDKIFAYQAKSIVYGCIAAKLAGINHIFALVAGLGSVFRNNSSLSFLKLVLMMQYRLALSCCERVFFQNNDDISECRRLRLIRAEQPCLIHGSGVNLELFTEQPLPDSDTFLFVGRLIKDKGLMEYLEASRIVKQKYPAAKFLLVGPFDTNPTAIQERDLKPYIEDGSVEYAGATDDVRPYLRQCSVFVLPSYHEGTPKSILEAMATARPIVTTDAPGCRETVVDRVNGFLVPVKDTQALANKMVWMIEHRKYLESMSSESLRICKDKYDVNKVNKVILNIMSSNPMEVKSMLDAIKDRETSIAVVGLGYVGLPLAVALSKRAKVIGFDNSIKKIERYKSGFDPTHEVGDEHIRDCTVEFTSNPEDIARAAFVIIAVPTPVDPHNKPDLSAISGASRVVGRYMGKGSVVVYESTVYPGVTEDVCVPILEQESEMICGTDFKVGYSPERINPGDKVHRLESIVKIVSGMDAESLEVVAGVYELIIEAGVFRASSIKVAEAAKVIENAQRDINIAFMNELSIIFNRLGIDTLDVLQTAGTKWNFLHFRPGLVGGHCIGVDPYYLTYKAEEIGYHPEVIPAGRRINDNMGKYVAESVVKQMIRDDCPIKGAKVLLMGVTFKENVPDVRNSKVADIVRELKEYGVLIYAIDPLADSSEIKEEYGFELAQEVPPVDAVIVAVNHQDYVNFPLEQIREKYADNRNVLVDVKGIYDRNEAEALGFKYWRL
ncbi:nucleotide sugar dehydrogenase [Paenibacillus sp. UMB4589-SE434]|uniref:nucleotide sugar dehydrogenase n=1 Tax=Paenibacillus sp. UMB4589-SE434 TaxID=3046314 RepID=UPI0033130888